MKLDARDERMLALFGTRRLSGPDLAAALDAPPGAVSDRLAELADSGLVRELDDGRYARTESGRRVLVASAAGTADERVDTTPEVERAIEGLDLRADEADAVRHVYAFLRYWGRVTEEEIVDAIYGEAPAGRETADEWWEGLLRDALAALPGVDSPDDSETDWRWAGASAVEGEDPLADGRRMLGTHPVYGDVKHALESIDLTAAEREAARAAFRYLYRRGDATEREIREAVYPDFEAGHASAQAWWEGAIEVALDALPGVERADGGGWRYRRPRPGPGAGPEP